MMALYATIRYVILWRDPRTSGAIFLSMLTVFVALLYYSVLVVLTCIAIPSLVITLGIRTVYAAKCFFLKKPVENPFQCWLAERWEINGNRLDSINKIVADTANRLVLNIKRKLLVESIIESLKGLLYLFIWYYIGKNISGMSLIFIGFVGIFTIPKLFEIYRREIDTILKMVDVKYNEIIQRVVELVPSLASRGSGHKKSFKSKLKVENRQTKNENESPASDIKEQKID